jgi:hypothetical protein
MTTATTPTRLGILLAQRRVLYAVLGEIAELIADGDNAYTPRFWVVVEKIGTLEVAIHAAGREIEEVNDEEPIAFG